MNSIIENYRYNTKKKFNVFCNMHEICQCAKLNQIYILPVTFYTANWIFIYPTNIVYKEIVEIALMRSNRMLSRDHEFMYIKNNEETKYINDTHVHDV